MSTIIRKSKQWWWSIASIVHVFWYLPLTLDILGFCSGQLYLQLLHVVFHRFSLWLKTSQEAMSWNTSQPFTAYRLASLVFQSFAMEHQVQKCLNLCFEAWNEMWWMQCEKGNCFDQWIQAFRVRCVINLYHCIQPLAKFMILYDYVHVS